MAKRNKLMVLKNVKEAAQFKELLDETWMTTYIGASLMGWGFDIIIIMVDLNNISEQDEQWINMYLTTKIPPEGKILYLGGDYVC